MDNFEKQNIIPAPPSKSKRKKFTLIIFVVLILLAAGAYAKYFWQKTSESPAAEKISRIKTEQIEKDIIPKRMPSDFPWENGAAVVANKEVYDTALNFYSTSRIYKTSKTMTENTKIFSSYLKSGEWTNFQSNGNEKVKYLTADLGDKHIGIMLDYSSSGGNLVQVSLISK